MKEIKFRAWVYCKWLGFRPKEERNADNSNFWIEKWVMGVVKTIHFAKNKARVMDGSISSSKCHDYLIGDKCIIMQNTGLKDKNGKEIYQKDILGGIWEMSYIDWCNDCRQNQIFNCSNECMACAGDVHWNEICDDKALEVTGNVYQNPELLK